MPTAAQFQALHDELRQLGAVFVQAANLGDQELALWGSGLEPLVLHQRRFRAESFDLQSFYPITYGRLGLSQLSCNISLG